jgi:hypothetical protein
MTKKGKFLSSLMNDVIGFVQVFAHLSKINVARYSANELHSESCLQIDLKSHHFCTRKYKKIVSAKKVGVAPKVNLKAEILPECSSAASQNRM